MVPASLLAQYYFTGEVKDPHGDRLQFVTILVKSTGALYRTGSLGDYGIVSDKSDDTLTFAYDGYQTYKTSVSATDFLQVTLQTLPFPEKPSHRSSLITGSFVPDSSMPIGRGIYRSNLKENPFVPLPAGVSFPGSFSCASFNYIRRFLDMGLAVPPDAVKIEGMLSYYNMYYEEPENKDMFHCSSDLFVCPWNTAHQLLYLNICARKVDLGKAPPASLVFLIDASGSMDMPDKMPMIKSSLHLLVKNLRDIDTVSIVEYGGRVQVVAGDLPGSQKEKILRAIESIRPDGPTLGETGIRLAYKVARQLYIPGGNNRIILLTDGDINEGASEADDLGAMVEEQGKDGILLSCFGVGMDSSKVSKLAALAEKGKGNFAYMNEEAEAEELLLNELAPVKYNVADNMCISADFNSALVSSWRLIGFDNKRSALQDTGFTTEAGRVGSGHSLFALFELDPKKDSTGRDTVAEIKIKYCLPGQNAAKVMNFACPNKPILYEKVRPGSKKAACIALFGMKLRGSSYSARISWMEMEKMIRKTFTDNLYMDREYIALVVMARRIYEHHKSEEPVPD